MPERPPASTAICTVPNLISAARLGLSIAAFVAIAREAWTAGLAIFLVAATTDWLDGWYARRFAAVSVLGRVLDPLVDKVLVGGCYVLLAAAGGGSIAAWMAVVVVVRELVVTAVRGEMERQGIDFSASPAGKLKMVAQCAAIGLDLADRAGIAGSLSIGAVVAAWAAVLLTISSAAEYLWAARGVLTGRNAERL